MADEQPEYGQDANPRGSDFDPPHTPQRESRMKLKAEREEVQLDDQPCPVCGGIHERKP